MNSAPRATLWLFGYSGVTAATHSCVVRDCAGWPNLSHWVMGANDALISRTRSRGASWFLKDDRQRAGDVLLMVDHDIQWQPGDLSNIARRALERNAIVAGLYPKRAFGEGLPVRLEDEGEWQIGEDRLIAAQYVSSGFMAVPRALLQALSETLVWIEDGFWPFFLPLVVKRKSEGKEIWEYLSEDWSLCERAREAGFGIYAACLPKLTHEGNYTYRLIDSASKPLADEAMRLKLDSSVPALAGKRG